MQEKMARILSWTAIGRAPQATQLMVVISIVAAKQNCSLQLNNATPWPFKPRASIPSVGQLLTKSQVRHCVMCVNVEVISDSHLYAIGLFRTLDIHMKYVLQSHGTNEASFLYFFLPNCDQNADIWSGHIGRRSIPPSQVCSFITMSKSRFLIYSLTHVYLLIVTHGRCDRDCR